MTHTLAFLGSIGWPEILLLAIVGLLIFGRRLPEVGRSLGKGIVEFKKGLQGIEDDVNAADTTSNAGPKKIDQTSSQQVQAQPREPADAKASSDSTTSNT